MAGARRGGLLAAFPLAYAVILPALYLPLVLMLVGLILRGVAFEFRFKAERFAAGTGLRRRLAARRADAGHRLGAFIQGFAVVDQHYAGGAFDWLTPFSIVTAFALIAGYMLLACGWLIMKTTRACATGPMRWPTPSSRSRIHPRRQHMDAAAESVVAARWFKLANIVMFSPVPVVTAAVVVALYRALRRAASTCPSPHGARSSSSPTPGSRSASFPTSSRRISRSGRPPPAGNPELPAGRSIPILPIILGYTAYSYYVFWDATEHDAYH